MYLVIGASSGLGLEIVKNLSKDSKVLGIARTKSNYNNKNYRHLKIDINKGIKILDENLSTRSINSVIFTVGIYLDHDNVDLKESEMLKLISTNFLSIVKVINFLRLKKKLTDTCFISICSSFTTYFQRDSQAFYSISKNALDRYIDSLRMYNFKFNKRLYINKFTIGILEKTMKNSKKKPIKLLSYSLKKAAKFIISNNKSKNKNFILPAWWILFKILFFIMPKFIKYRLRV